MKIFIIIIILLGLMFIPIPIKTNVNCIQAPCPSTVKLPIGFILLSKLFPNNFVY
ncbi:MAG: hypothetical protein QG644_390 [Patescibacteria group bacterium]|jgi:hypothetical protein|nr:hypothetical protein [Patescibacteria group bacterium]